MARGDTSCRCWPSIKVAHQGLKHLSSFTPRKPLTVTRLMKELTLNNNPVHTNLQPNDDDTDISYKQRARESYKRHQCEIEKNEVSKSRNYNDRNRAQRNVRPRRSTDKCKRSTLEGGMECTVRCGEWNGWSGTVLFRRKSSNIQR